MDKPLILKRTSTSDSTFDIRYCIICQKGTLNDKDLKSLPAGRSRIITAAEIRRDRVWSCLQSTQYDESFKYHMNNNCYKTYTLQKTLESIKLKNDIKPAVIDTEDRAAATNLRKRGQGKPILIRSPFIVSPFDFNDKDSR